MRERWARWRTWVAFAVLGWLFYVASKGAYRGFFSSDDLDNLAWTRHAPWLDFFTGLVTPVFYSSNFRPLGHLYFRVLGPLAGWDFRPYVVVLHALHLLNMGLAWKVMEGAGLQWGARLFGVLFFGFHMAVFDAYWKPMYIFDVLCAAFCLGAMWAWMEDRRWVSLGLFWLGYKSKELAVALPAVLFAYEYWVGGKRYRKLAPMGAAAAVFAVQALLLQGGRGGDYGLRLTPETLWRTVDYYMSQVLLAPQLGFALLAVPFVARDKRVWFGLAACALFLGPMLEVPGRLYGAYLYLPLAGLALAAGAIAERVDWRLAAAAMALWVGVNYVRMRELRRETLAEADETRAFAMAVRDLARHSPELDTFLVDAAPRGMRRWGIEGALRYAFDRDGLTMIYLEDKDRALPAGEAKLALISWDAPVKRLYSLRRTEQGEDAAWIEMTRLTPVWQLGPGWYQQENNYRWSQPRASARVRWPEGAREFAVTVNIGPDYIREIGRVRLKVLLNGREVGEREFNQNGWFTVPFPVAELDKTATADVEFVVDPVFHPRNGDPRPLGIPVGAFGFR
jgi:hypothetical protein